MSPRPVALWLLVGAIALAACGNGNTSTTTTATPTTTYPDLSAELALLEVQLGSAENLADSVTAERDALRLEVETLEAEVEELESAFASLGEFAEALELDLAEWEVYAATLEASVASLQAALDEATAVSFDQWCAEYQLALETAGNEHARNQGFGSMTFGAYQTWVNEPLVAAGC